MLRSLFLAIIVLLVVLGGRRPPARAANPYVLQFDMHGAQVVPPVDSIGWGFLRLFFSPDRLSADYTVDVKGFSGNIVLGADLRRAPPGSNGPVLHHLADGGFITMGSHATFSNAELDDMATGLWYVTVYTALHPNGEMRGQIVLPADFRPPAPTPVPAEAPAIVQFPATTPFLVPGFVPSPALQPLIPPPSGQVLQAPVPAPPPQEPPLETAPVTPVVISPPNTGDGGLAGWLSEGPTLPRAPA